MPHYSSHRKLVAGLLGNSCSGSWRLFDTSTGRWNGENTSTCKTSKSIYGIYLFDWGALFMWEIVKNLVVIKKKANWKEFFHSPLFYSSTRCAIVFVAEKNSWLFSHVCIVFNLEEIQHSLNYAMNAGKRAWEARGSLAEHGRTVKVPKTNRGKCQRYFPMPLCRYAAWLTFHRYRLPKNPNSKWMKRFSCCHKINLLLPFLTAYIKTLSLIRRSW